MTEYKGRFEEISPKRGPFRRPVDLIKREGKTNSDTTNRTSYLPHKVEAPKQKEPETFVPNPHRFEAISEHHENYKHLEGVPARIPPYLKSTTMRKPSAKIHYVSTKQDDFKTYGASTCRRPDAVTREKPYRPPSKPFQGTSIHRQDFTRFNQAPNPSARQPDKLNFGDNPVNFQTTNRSFHKPLPNVIRMRPVERHSDDSAVSLPKSAFASKSVFRSDFVDHKAIKSAHMFKPASLLFKTDDAMDSETTQGNAFKVWPVSKQERRAPDVYKKPEGLIEIKPTSSDYAHHGAQGIPAKSARPRTKLQRGREFPFNPTTSYSVEFKIHEKLPARERLKRDRTDGNEIFPKSEENGATVGTSEFLDKFKRHQVAPARMFKGNSSLFKTTANLSDTTLYAEQFRGERIECPSERLLRNDNFGAFSFDHVTEEGHKVYEISPRGADNLRREMTVA